MRGLWKLTLTEALLYLREPVATFFTIFYAPLVLLLFGSIYGNKPSELFGGRGTMDVTVPAYIGLIVVTVSLMGLPIATVSNRELGVLRRYRATPLRPVTYLTAQVLVYSAMTLLGVLLLFLTGKLVYQIRFEGSFLSVLAGLILSTLSFLSLGFLVASLSPTPRLAQMVGMILAFGMMFLSGATFPLEIMPERVRQVSNFLPLTHVVKLMRGLWAGQSWGGLWVHGVVLGGLLVACVAVSAVAFRWE